MDYSSAVYSYYYLTYYDDALVAAVVVHPMVAVPKVEAVAVALDYIAVDCLYYSMASSYFVVETYSYLHDFLDRYVDQPTFVIDTNMSHTIDETLMVVAVAVMVVAMDAQVCI